MFDQKKVENEIQESYKIPSKILEAASNEELVLFLGAGVSIGFGCSSWEKLASNLLETCYSEGVISFIEKRFFSKETNAKKIITICESLLKKNGKEQIFQEKMKEAFNDEKVEIEKQSENEIYKKNFKMIKQLTKLKVPIITTNADRHIDQFFKSKDYIKYNSGEFTINTDLNKEYLYKIHGSISDFKSLVFTTTQYLERYNNERFLSFIRKIFQENTVLFIGYGLQELELLDHLITKIGGKKVEKKHFLLKEYELSQSKIIEIEQHYFDQLGIQIQPYYLDKKGFEELKEVIDRWSKKWKNDITGTNIENMLSFDEITEALENPHD